MSHRDQQKQTNGRNKNKPDSVACSLIMIVQLLGLLTVVAVSPQRKYWIVTSLGRLYNKNCVLMRSFISSASQEVSKPVTIQYLSPHRLCMWPPNIDPHTSMTQRIILGTFARGIGGTRPVYGLYIWGVCGAGGGSVVPMLYSVYLYTRIDAALVWAYLLYNRCSKGVHGLTKRPDGDWGQTDNGTNVRG